MSKVNANNNMFKIIQNFIYTNYKGLIIILFIVFTAFIGFQLYNYFKIQNIKNSSISFFDIIQENDDDLIGIDKIIDDANIFSVLSKLKLIQKNIEKNNFGYVNDLYKDIIFKSNLDPLYKSAIAANASYTFINASYYKKSDMYLNDISTYIDNISNEFNNYFSIKNELEYLLLVTAIDLNSSEYKKNSEALEKYNEISNSTLISAPVKERVKKIHEFQLYK